MNARDRRTLRRTVRRRLIEMGVQPMAEDMRSMTFSSACVVRNSMQQNLWIRRKVQEDKRPKFQARPGHGSPSTSRKWGHLMNHLGKLQLLRTFQRHAPAFPEGTQVEYTRKDGTTVTGTTDTYYPQSVLNDYGAVLVKGPAYRLKLTPEDAKRVGHPVTVTASRLRVVITLDPVGCDFDLSTHDFDTVPRVRCDEPVLGDLRVCYDHAKLCPECREEPVNPGETCNPCPVYLDEP